MTKDEIAETLRLHQLWVDGEPEGIRANLIKANLQEANLIKANLQWANLYRADLVGVNLRWANLRYADLQGADLVGTNLQGANLTDAYFNEAIIDDILEARLVSERSIVPVQGSFTGYKAARCQETWKLIILTLEIPADAQRMGGVIRRKCRAEKAKVVSAYWKNNGKAVDPLKTVICSVHDPDFIYKIGEMSEPDKYDPRVTHECSSGIHFFMEEQEAREYLR